MEIKKEYVEDLKTNLLIHTSDKITPFINQANQGIQDKMQLFFGEKVIGIENKLNQVVEYYKKNMDNNVQLAENVAALVKKMENSSIKGGISENLLNNVLVNSFPNGELVNTSKETHHGDILLKRTNKVDILFENKDYSSNVPKKEIEKFIEDINLHDCCGIMLSQKSGISLKDNFQIEIHGENIVIYLHNVMYSNDLIKTAVNIIDHLQKHITSNIENSIEIDQDILDSINMEYKNYVLQRLEHIESIKNMSNKLIKEVENFNFNSIEILLNKHYTNSITNEFECICGRIWKTKRSMGCHQKTCKMFKEKHLSITQTGRATSPAGARYEVF
jgi:hypothetical protein